MKLKWKDLIYGFILLVLFAGFFAWLVISAPATTLMIVLGSAIILTGIITFIVKFKARQMEINSGIPAQDEYVKLAKVYAGNQ